MGRVVEDLGYGFLVIRKVIAETAKAVSSPAV
jgi:hypothetical protein